MGKNRLRITSFIILVLFALSLVACDNSGEESVESSEVSDQETAESSTEVEESESAEVTEESELESESEEETEGLSFTAGTYQGKGEGHNGSLVLDVTFTEEGLESIDVVSSEETKFVSEPAIERLTNQAIEGQTLALDNVTGATVTSTAFKRALEEATAQATDQVDALKTEVAKADGEHKELTTDLLVIGGGGAGMSAAIAADEEGLSVILLEKNAMLGGHTAFSGGLTLVTGSKLQEETYGITDDSADLVYEDNFINGGGISIEEDLRLYSDYMGMVTDWSIEYAGAGPAESLIPLGENRVDRVMEYEGAGAGLSNALAMKMEETDVEILMETKATSLVTDENGKVIGIEAEDIAGNTYTITAENTILATGSYAARNEWLPERLDNFVYYGAQLSQGEGQEMAQVIGADVVNQGEVELFENGVEWIPGIAKSTYNGSMASWKGAGILVDKEGNRVVNERAAGKDIVAVMEQEENAMLYLFLDQATYDLFKSNITGYGISEEMLDGWVEVNGETRPYFAKADTVEDVAAILEIDADNLQATIERYNSFVQTGNDEDFSRDPAFMTAEIGEGPYYLIEQVPRFATTLGGLRINNKLQVINTDGEVIEGLYAAGDVSGGARGNDSIPGADVGWALTSGYLAAKNAAGVEVTTEYNPE